MRFILTLFVLLSSASNLAAQSGRAGTANADGTAEFTVNKGSHVAKLILTSQNFVPSAHRIVRTKGCVLVDGRRPIGTDCGIPVLEIALMRLFMDGKEIAIPKHLYSDCYSVGVLKDDREPGLTYGHLAIEFSEDLKGVFVFLSGGDGAGVYDAVWILRKDGRHSRLTHSGGDCRFLNLDCHPGAN